MTQTAPSQPAERPKAIVLLRFLAIFYDFWPMVAIWMVLSALFNLGFYLAGHDKREILDTFSPLGVLLWLCCLLATGAYAVLSWARGGQTLGMRPWRLRVVGADGMPATRTQLIRRFGFGLLSLLPAGFGFWWAWFDRDRLAWHDRVSGTRMVRVEKR